VLAEVANREDRLEHRLETRVLALARQTVHLQKALVRLLLDLDQVRDRNGRLDFRKVDALAVDVLGKAVHSLDLEEKTERDPMRMADCGPRIQRKSAVSIRSPRSEIRNYLISTLAPTSSNFFLM